jgi:PAS domain S-box-containing protein
MSPAVPLDTMDYRSYFDLSGEMLATTDLAGRFTTVNESFKVALGYTGGDLLGRSKLEFVHPDDRAGTEAEIASLQAGTRQIKFENRFRCQDGSYRWLRWSATPSPVEDRIYALVIDVTDLRAKDEALDRLVLDLERSNEELLQFAYVASHDLSEPLRVVAGHVELLASRYQGRLDEDADRYIAFAVAGCGRMRSLIDDLLAFSRAGREGGAEDSVDLAEVMDSVLASLDDLVQESQAEIVVGPMPTVIGSSSQFTQILANLVANSLKFHVPGTPPQIEVRSAREGSGWRIEVHDEGIGVEPPYRDRIFRIFQRLHGGDAYPGTGIGLSICRKMVDLRGGKIWCAGSEGAGTTFCFTVPDRTGAAW